MEFQTCLTVACAATDAGLNYLDCVDYYINYCFLISGFFESFGAGWIYGIEDSIRDLGAPVVFSYMLTNFGSIIIASGLWFGLDNDNQVWGGFVGFFVSYLGGLALTYVLLQQRLSSMEEPMDMSTAIYKLTFENVINLKNQLEPVVGWIPTLWAVMMKQMIPHVLLILFFNMATTNNAEGDPKYGNYGSYETWPFQVIGILCTVTAAAVVLIGLAAPKLFEGADLVFRQRQEMEDKLGHRSDEEMNDKVLEEEAWTRPL